MFEGSHPYHSRSPPKHWKQDQRVDFAWKMLGKGRFKGLGKNELDSDSNESFFGVQTKIFRGSPEKQ